MRRIEKMTIGRRAEGILRDNEGASLVLVTVIAIIILTCVVILRVTTSTLWASADKQRTQDKAYVEATTMGASIDYLISDGTINLSNYTSSTDIVVDGSVVANITPSGNGYIVTVSAKEGNSTYVYTAYYFSSGRSGEYTRQMI